MGSRAAPVRWDGGKLGAGVQSSGSPSVQVLVGFIWSATGLQNRTGRKNLSTNGAVLQQSYVP